MLNGGPFFWKSQHQDNVSLSPSEAGFIVAKPRNDLPSRNSHWFWMCLNQNHPSHESCLHCYERKSSAPIHSAVTLTFANTLCANSSKLGFPTRAFAHTQTLNGGWRPHQELRHWYSSGTDRPWLRMFFLLLVSYVASGADFECWIRKLRLYMYFLLDYSCVKFFSRFWCASGAELSLLFFLLLCLGFVFVSYFLGMWDVLGGGCVPALQRTFWVGSASLALLRCHLGVSCMVALPLGRAASGGAVRARLGWWKSVWIYQVLT